MSSYSVYQILNKCPETIKIRGEEKIIYEFCIKDLRKYLKFFFFLFDGISNENLNRFKTDEIFLSDYLKILYSKTPKNINQIINILYPELNINETVMNKEYINILFKGIKQNDILNFLLAPSQEKTFNSLDEYDLIFKIIHYKLVDITFLDYDVKLTYRQLKFFSEKISNFEKLMMFNFYTPIRKCLSEMFASKDSENKPFFDILFKSEEEIKKDKFLNARQNFFKEKYNDDEFIIKMCKEKNLNALMFFEYNKVKEIFPEQLE